MIPVTDRPLPGELSADANGPYDGTVNIPLDFDGSGSTPADAIVEYRWDFGDGNTDVGAEAVISHTYTAAGTYTVNLTVVGANRQQATDTTTATITAYRPSRLPVAVIDVLKTAQCYRFDGSGSTPEGAIVEYGWDFGDGNTDVGRVVEHCYEASGTYTVTLTVTDEQGRTSSASADVVVPYLMD